jgi:hypothetical protein
MLLVTVSQIKRPHSRRGMLIFTSPKCCINFVIIKLYTGVGPIFGSKQNKVISLGWFVLYVNTAAFNDVVFIVFVIIIVQYNKIRFSNINLVPVPIYYCILPVPGTDNLAYSRKINFTIQCGEVKRIVMGLDKFKRTPCGFCFVEFYTREDAENSMRFLNGTRCVGYPHDKNSLTR